VIQTTFNVARAQVQELQPGEAILVSSVGEVEVKRILEKAKEEKCSFERIYFSRGSDADIYQERKALGRNLVDPLVKMLEDGGDTPRQIVDNTVFSFIPNTAEVAFIGLVEGMEDKLDALKLKAISSLMERGDVTQEELAHVLNHKLRIEKVAIKDIKLRTFITEGTSRDTLAAHVYDVTYGCIVNNKDTLVVIDDSIVRGTTLRQSILKMLDRLHPRRIIVVSSSPQVRYPDFYGIDMSRLGEFIAFRAAIALLKEKGMEHVLESTYHRAQQLLAAEHCNENAVQDIYAPFSDEDISRKIAEMLTPANTSARVDILYQNLEGLAASVPNHTGAWYFSGDYPTEGGYRLVNKAFINYYEGNVEKR
jgi:amidophosphoribosyltransferase